MNFFTDAEIAAVRWCFSTVTPLPDPAVERILQALITTKDYIDNWGGMRLEFYKDDRPHGKWKAWLKNGQKWYEENYKDGHKHEKWEVWHSNGQKWGSNEYNYKDGKLRKWEVWRANGQKLYEELYNDGIINKPTLV